jgi:diguanylate cyclase (GGDEF)-like protein
MPLKRELNVIEIISILLIVLIITIVIYAIVRRKVSHLKKIVAQQSEEIHDYKNKEHQKENFVSMLAETTQHGTEDPSTQLFTLPAFNVQFDKLIAQSKRFNNIFALVMVEISPLKRNQAEAMPINHEILNELGKRLKETIRETDMACYYKNNTFLILLTDVPKPEVIVHGVERIIDRLHFPYDSKEENATAKVDVHAAITLYPYDGENKETLLENAKLTLEKAKNEGKNLFQFYQQETQILSERELSLKAAIKNPDFLNDVSLEYRPYYNIKTNEITCIHVVPVLNHPELGQLSSDEFLRMTHYSSRLFDLYKWMMDTAISKFELSTEIKSKPKRFIFSFNLKQLEIRNFLHRIVPIIQKLSSEDNEIIMEIEDDEILPSQQEAFRNVIQELNGSNIPMIIGILTLGHFAINKINQLHFRYLKIDKKLVKDLGNRQESLTILEKIVALSNSLEIESLTAGVDTAEQKTILENLGCKILQGKIFDRRQEGFFIESERV